MAAAPRIVQPGASKAGPVCAGPLIVPYSLSLTVTPLRSYLAFNACLHAVRRLQQSLPCLHTPPAVQCLKGSAQQGPWRGRAPLRGAPLQHL